MKSIRTLTPNLLASASLRPFAGLHQEFTLITATGTENAVTWQIDCIWTNGLPLAISYSGKDVGA